MILIYAETEQDPQLQFRSELGDLCIWLMDGAETSTQKLDQLSDSPPENQNEQPPKLRRQNAQFFHFPTERDFQTQ